MNETLGQHVVAALRAANAYAAGDQVAPCVVLWPDPDRLWEPVMQELQPMMPELFLLGSYAPENRTGPALWLRCIEARVVGGSPAPEPRPFFICLASVEKSCGPQRIVPRNYRRWWNC